MKVVDHEDSRRGAGRKVGKKEGTGTGHQDGPESGSPGHIGLSDHYNSDQEFPDDRNTPEKAEVPAVVISSLDNPKEVGKRQPTTRIRVNLEAVDTPRFVNLTTSTEHPEDPSRKRRGGWRNEKRGARRSSAVGKTKRPCPGTSKR